MTASALPGIMTNCHSNSETSRNSMSVSMTPVTDIPKFVVFRDVAVGETGVGWTPAPLLPNGVPDIDADPVSIHKLK